MRRALPLALVATLFTAGTLVYRVRTTDPVPPVIEPEVRAILDHGRPGEGADQLEWLYTVANYPYGAVLPIEIYQDMLNDQGQTPDESSYKPGGQRRIALEDWEFAGPQGMAVRGSSQTYSGRISDLDWNASTGIRVGAANGGLWQFEGSSGFALSDLVAPLAVGSFDTHPADANSILLGTGEPGVHTGSGIWRTSNAGANWVPASMSPTPAVIYRLRFSPWKLNEVHAATSSGHFRSDDSGATWTRKFTGNCTDLAFDPAALGDMYAAFWERGIYKSPDSGETWVKLTGSAMPDSTAFGRTSLAVAPSAPQQVWALIASPSSPKVFTHLLKSTNGGTTWTDIGLPSGFDTAQGGYNHILSVSPTNANIVMLGGVGLWRTTNGGDDWSEVNDIHADEHSIAWNPDGLTVWVGNDGGLYTSTDAGAHFTTVNNTLPITQYQSIDVCSTDPQVVVGGAQDNGYSHTTDLTNWEVSRTGDGGRALLKPGVCGISWVGMGFYDGPKAWRRFRSTDSFATYEETENGIDPNDNWYPDTRVEPVTGALYTHADNDVFFSVNDGSTWARLNPVGFAHDVASVTAERGSFGAVYVTTNSEVTGSRVQVYKDGVWTNRDSGLPSTGLIRRVVPHPAGAGRAYLIVSQLDFADTSPRVYTTTDWGATWVPTTTGLGTIAPLDITSHPEDPNQIFLSTTTGMRWSPNGGTSWFTWSAGMPTGVEVFDMSWTKVTGAAPGEWWLYAGSMGRGVWRRKVAAGVAPGAVSPSLSVVNVIQREILAQPDGSGLSLAAAGATIEVQVLDAASIPIPHIPASQITLNPYSGTALAWCTLPYRADGPTDFSGRTTFSGALPASGNTFDLRVTVNGVPLNKHIYHKIRSTDINRDFVVDLCDLVQYDADREYWIDTGAAPPGSDLDFDHDIDLGDKLILDTAINEPRICRTSGIVLEPPTGELGVWFDLAGTQFGQLVPTGGEFEFYVIARGFNKGARGIEFSLPALLDPAIDVLLINWLVTRSTDDEGTDPFEFRFVLPEDCTVVPEIPIMKIRARLNAPVDELRICAAPATATSFLDSDMPGWINCDDPVERVPFASVSCGVVNPFGSAIWSGFLVEAFSPGVITLLEDRLDLGGLGAATGGMRIDLTGAGPSLLTRGASDATGVDGMGLQFLSTLPVANLPAGATVQLRADGPSETPCAGILGTAEGNNGPMDFAFIGDPAYQPTELQLGLNDAPVLQLSGFDPAWKSSEGIPSTFAVLHRNGELVLLQEWQNPVTLLIDGQNYVADTMELTTSTNGTVPEGLLWSAFVGGGMIGDLQIGWQAVQRFNQGFIFAQNAYLRSLENRMELVRMDWSQPGQVRLESLIDGPLTLYPSGPNPAAYPDGYMSMNFVDDQTDTSLRWNVVNFNGDVRLSVDTSGLTGNPGWVARGELQGNQTWEYPGPGTDIVIMYTPPLTTTLTLGAVVTRPMTITGGKMPDELGGGVLAPFDQIEVSFPNAPVVPDGAVIEFEFGGGPVVHFFGAPVVTAAPPKQPPTRTALLPNIPNPFNPRTQIRYEVAVAGPVRLQVYDVRGRLVSTLVDGYRDAGVWSEEWSGRDDRGQPVASGVYHVRMVTAAGADARKIVLVK